MNNNQLPADAQGKALTYSLKGSWVNYPHPHPDKMFYPGTGQSEVYSRYLDGYIAGATAEAKRAQENKRLLDEAQTLLSKEREKGWKLFNALEWIKTYGPVDDLTIKFIDKALQQWKDRKDKGNATDSV